MKQRVYLPRSILSECLSLSTNSIVIVKCVEGAAGGVQEGMRERGGGGGGKHEEIGGRSILPEERTMAIVFLPRRPKAPGDTFAYFFSETCIRMEQLLHFSKKQEPCCGNTSISWLLSCMSGIPHMRFCIWCILILCLCSPSCTSYHAVLILHAASAAVLYLD